MIQNEDKEREFSEMITTYGQVIAKVCYFYAEDMDDFNDLRQESLINLWRGFDSFRGSSQRSTWIYRVCLNSCVSFFRKNRRKRDSVSIDKLPELIAPDEDRAELMREMYALINRLSKSEKALVLLWLDQCSYDEIADVMGLPRNTVASRLRRIKEKLVKYSNE
ncbi:MAG: sigma-70 family RNA polymerase sigma factor [Lachnospiraceae bacterium]|nr:sigma-70 family RNA polymerase sigma factor [Lachnospiraceae bacterium]